MKKTRKLIIVLIMMMCMILFISSNVEAAFNAGDIFDMGDKFISDGKSSTTLDEGEISSIFIPIAQIMVRIGTAIIAVVTLILGIQYMSANAEDKAKLKTRLVTLVIATIVLSGAQVIWATLYNFLESTL